MLMLMDPRKTLKPGWLKEPFALRELEWQVTHHEVWPEIPPAGK